ncbi:50S ribosomal protein L11 methyltransferase [Bacterioplanes sanyensis]|uniref:Ribosomal protein L11 methyltransferase n=1 Tax=Bacterioplanes sanyensis TaxID=1249553 RepID=A0A222FKP6_9GAMM|nr:50S ribosomal protein L11 methyltransferase [Bacterioplanes sanyensis]ASP38941.1 50S ribosomal protein L11 methyltransferase [Bacterioplanes sanyensis]
MPWIQARLHAAKEQVDALEDALLATGALSVTLMDDADQPILEPELGTTPLWDQTLLLGLYDANTEADTLQQRLQLAFTAEGGALLPNCKIEILEDKDWVRAWMDDYQAMQFGQRLWVCPSWQQPPEPDAVNLMLDPGLAFGTGTHPTTALCLSYLDSAIQGGEHILDFGCGSGILGMAALLLGAERMTGTDIDPQALEATQENAKRNGIEPARFQVFLPENTPELQADVTIANILAGPLRQLAPHIAQLTRPGGQLALSGILAEQASEVQACYQQWFEMDDPQFLDDWALLSGRKRQER